MSKIMSILNFIRFAIILLLCVANCAKAKADMSSKNNLSSQNTISYKNLKNNSSKVSSDLKKEKIKKSKESLTILSAEKKRIKEEVKARLVSNKNTKSLKNVKNFQAKFTKSVLAQSSQAKQNSGSVQIKSYLNQYNESTKLAIAIEKKRSNKKRNKNLDRSLALSESNEVFDQGTKDLNSYKKLDLNKKRNRKIKLSKTGKNLANTPELAANHNPAAQSTRENKDTQETAYTEGLFEVLASSSDNEMDNTQSDKELSFKNDRFSRIKLNIK